MLPRRTLLLQTVSLATLTACTGTPDKGDDAPDPTDPSDTGALDTGGGDTGSGDTGTEETGLDDTGGTDTGGADTGGVDAACDRDDPLPASCEPTGPDGEGPYFREDAPERTFLNVRGVDGTRLVLAGRLLDHRCQPVEGGVVYLWSAGPEGFYDNTSPDPNLYGRTTTATDGTFCFETLRPPPYGPETSRLPAHLHLNFFVRGAKVLTTQLTFAGDPYLPPGADLRRNVTPEPLAGGGERIVFDFVLRPSTSG
jgi:protocatechuate 3,4-dioxygenase beta subunit